MPYKSIEVTAAQSVFQQPPKTSHFYYGFSSIDISNTNSKLYDLSLIQQDILNQFQTRKGERVMNPNFGSIIWHVLMEPMTDQVHDLILQDVQTICNSDPRVVPVQVSINEQPGGYLIEITLTLVGTDQSATMVLNFNQEIGLSVQ